MYDSRFSVLKGCDSIHSVGHAVGAFELHLTAADVYVLSAVTWSLYAMLHMLLLLAPDTITHATSTYESWVYFG